jgi:hypothetical protein
VLDDDKVEIMDSMRAPWATSSSDPPLPRKDCLLEYKDRFGMLECWPLSTPVKIVNSGIFKPEICHIEIFGWKFSVIIAKSLLGC